MSAQAHCGLEREPIAFHEASKIGSTCVVTGMNLIAG